MVGVRVVVMVDAEMKMLGRGRREREVGRLRGKYSHSSL